MEMDVVQHAQLKLATHDLEARYQVLIYALRNVETVKNFHPKFVMMEI